MNLPRYEFYKENRQLLLGFLKIANEQKNNKCCNHKEYKILNKFFPLQSNIKSQLQESIANESIVINIIDSEDETDDLDPVTADNDSTLHSLPAIDCLNLTAIDISYAIKENLDTQKSVLSTTISNLQCSNNLEDIFVLLAGELNFEEVLNFGKSFQNDLPINQSVIMFYVKYLLLNKANVEFSEDVRDILNNLTQRYMHVITEELSKYLLDAKVSISKVFLQLLENLNKNVQIHLLRNIAFNCGNLEDNCIGVIDTLLNNQIDFETLSKLVELLSSAVDKYKSDKSFGKLIINLLKVTGKNIHLLEQPLEYIVSSHKSIWKSKIQKLFQESLDETSFMSQSFR